MPATAPDRGHSPIPGESRLTVVTLGVFLGLGTAGLIAALVASAFIAGLEATVVVAWVFFAIAAIGFAVAYVQRRNYLRDVAIGKVIEREPWTGADLLPPG